MKHPYLRQHGRDSLELVEEAFHFLRTAKPATLAAYYLGSTPFVAAFLFFWFDMSFSPFGAQHLAGTALVLAALFLWMKFCQAAFTRLLRAELSVDSRENPRLSYRSLATQAIFQSSALFVVPLAAIALLPFAWVYAFYQNVAVLDDGRTEGRALFRKACEQAGLWPGQNHCLLLILSGFGFSVFLNWASFCLFAPHLLKMFFDLETPFSQSPLSMLNPTFLTALVGLTYLCLDPLVKACYVLRCFYGNSLHSGEDIKTELRQLTRAARPAVIALALWLGMAGGQAAEPPAPPPQAPPAVSAPALDRSIANVTSQAKYTWRMPREKSPAQRDSLFARFFKRAAQLIEDGFRALQKFLDWLFRDKRSDSASEEWKLSRQSMLFLLIAVVACALAVILVRSLRDRKKNAGAVKSEMLEPMPDLQDESLSADQLPEDSWTKLGRELLERGDLRLALRAFYLASLAHLAGRGLVRIVRSKSNRDYERELQRRGSRLQGLPELFGDNVNAFDRAWYGLHEVNAEILTRFMANLDKIKATA